ncbi:MAG: 2-oxo acid dehydrogenase subunit E2 [Planctomycetaceae bacterium]|jgi:pyruvate dehydrogenase E2 component (dihydrolipoamide acetyltransferase)|nr:2-oxo acid dehydrogenase subunit E2 [Planctomycetaceae bacterium]
MATEIKLPSLGEGVESGDVLEIYVKVGDVVKLEQSLLELETDKATVAVPSPFAGKILSLAVKEGETVKVGQVIGTIEAASAAAAPSKPEPSKPAAVAPAAPAPTPAAPAPAAAPVAPAAPVATKPVAPAPVAPPPAAPAPVAPAVNAVASASVAEASEDVIPAGPAVRRFAREVGVDLTGVSGSGEHGRITREDVLSIVRHQGQAANTKPAASAPASAPVATVVESPAKAAASKGIEKPGTPATDEYGPIRVDRMTKIRKTIANQMDKSWSTVPRVVNFDDADVTELEAFRQSSKDDYASRGIKLTTMPFLIKAVATALRHHGALNAVIDSENEQIIYKDYVNLGIAVDTDRGLVVPTLKNADRMSIPDIAYALAELSNRVRNNSFAVSDLRGGTFTISNLGAIGGTYSTPIVNVPEVAILLVGRSRKMPMVMPDDTIKPRLMMPLSLAYDHRLVDGATAARFLNDIIAYLEAPSRLLLAI